MYGGKVLERITHSEEPWKHARRGCADGIPSNELLPKDEIMDYYKMVDQKYGLSSEDGIKKYVCDMLRR